MMSGAKDNLTSRIENLLGNAGAKLGQTSSAERNAGIFTTALQYVAIPVGDGASLECGIVLPSDFDADKNYPVCIAISGERQQHVSRFFQAWKSEQRGWVVVSPLCPGTPLFFDRPELIQQLAVSLLTQFNVEGGKFHMVGTSNGGSTCFAFGTRWPQLCHSITPVTGANLRRDDLRLLNGIPIDMFVGDCDELRFHGAMVDILEDLENIGHSPPPTLAVLKGAGHFTIGQSIDMDSFWEMMDRRRAEC
jgi:predicted peptidase